MGRNDKAYGFEQKFREDYLKAFPNALCFKVPNQMSGFLSINNYSDFICFDSERLYFIDCKAHAGASFPFADFPQFDRLMTLVHIPKLMSGIILWLYDKDKVIFVPTISIAKMKKDGIKSFNPDKISKHKYYYVNVPSVKLRTYMNSDYTVLQNIPENNQLRSWGEDSK